MCCTFVPRNRYPDQIFDQNSLTCPLAVSIAGRRSRTERDKLVSYTYWFMSSQSEVLAAIDRHFDAGDITGVIRAQEEDEFSYLFRGPHPAQWNVRYDPCLRIR